MKKLAAAIFMSSALVAGIAEAAYESNFLLGASVGYINQNGQFSLSFNQTLLGLQESGTVALDHDGLIWGFLGGWQARCNYVLYGAEIYVDWQNQEKINLQSSIAPTALTPAGTIYAAYTNEIAVGLTGRVGFAMAPWIMPYVRCGVEATREKLETTVSFVTLPNPFISLEDKKTSWRFLVGIGVELPFPLIDGVSFRSEYNYHSRGRAAETSGTAVDGVTLVMANGSQVAHSAKASLIYNFS